MKKVDRIIDGFEKEIIETIRELVSIKSVKGEPEQGAPFGVGPKLALDKFLDISQRNGFRTGIFENMVGWAEYGNAKDPMVCILGHLDVVPEGDGWTFPPYAAETHHGKIYGRGVVDDKAPLICSLFALKAVIEAGIPLKHRVRILAGTNEESGSSAIKKYVGAGQEIPVAGFTPDAHYPLINGEKGILLCHCRTPFKSEGKIRILSMKGGTAANVVPAHCETVLQVSEDIVEKVRFTVNNWEGPKGTSASLCEDATGDLKITVNGVSAHGSIPETGINAIAWTVKLLLTLGISGEQGEKLKTLIRLMGTDSHGENLGICLYDKVSRYTSLCWGTIEVDDGIMDFSINPRYPVTYKETDVLPALKRTFKNEDISLSVDQKANPLYIPEDSDLVQKLMKVYRDRTGKDEKPLAIGGGTYAKAMPNILAFGPEFPGKSYHIHEADECWEITEIIENTKIVASAIIELAR